MSITTHLQTKDPPGPTRPINGRALPGSRAVVGGLLVALAGLGLFAIASGLTDGPPHRAVVALVDVAPGQHLEPGQLGTIDVDLPEVNADNTFADPGAVAGAVSLGPLAAGELVQRGTVRPATDSADRSGAFSFAIDRDRAVGGDLRPGDRVDVLATTGSGSGAETTIVARDAQVQAVTGAGDSTLGTSSRLTVTLAVPPDTPVIDLVHASAVGSLTLVRTTGSASQP